MRHWLLLFILLLAAYGLWQLGGRRQLRQAGRHALRILALALLLLGLLVLAYYSHAIKLL